LILGIGFSSHEDLSSDFAKRMIERLDGTYLWGALIHYIDLPHLVLFRVTFVLLVSALVIAVGAILLWILRRRFTGGRLGVLALHLLLILGLILSPTKALGAGSDFFDCGGERRLVDLPGYGYAAVSKEERAHWGRLIGQYLQGRASLRGLVVIADSRHPLTPLDKQLLGWHAASGQPLLVLLTKSDKLTRSEGAKALARAKVELPMLHPAATAVLFSAIDGTGQRHAHNTIAAWLEGR